MSILQKTFGQVRVGAAFSKSVAEVSCDTGEPQVRDSGLCQMICRFPKTSLITVFSCRNDENNIFVFFPLKGVVSATSHFDARKTICLPLCCSTTRNSVMLRRAFYCLPFVSKSQSGLVHRICVAKQRAMVHRDRDSVDSAENFWPGQSRCSLQ